MGRPQDSENVREEERKTKLGIIMESNYQKEERYNKAKKRVEDIKGFYGNLIAYVIVNIGLLILNLAFTPDQLWFFWPLLGWGIGVVFHGMKVFDYMPFLSKDWEERKMKEFMEKENEKKDSMTGSNREV